MRWKDFFSISFDIWVAGSTYKASFICLVAEHISFFHDFGRNKIEIVENSLQFFFSGGFPIRVLTTGPVALPPRHWARPGRARRGFTGRMAPGPSHGSDRQATRRHYTSKYTKGEGVHQQYHIGRAFLLEPYVLWGNWFFPSTKKLNLEKNHVKTLILLITTIVIMIIFRFKHSLSQN